MKGPSNLQENVLYYFTHFTRESWIASVSVNENSFSTEGVSFEGEKTLFGVPRLEGP